MRKLPRVLEREPLVDAVFEVRLGGLPHLADILPGVLFEYFSPKPAIVRLPAADMPQPIRANDPELQFAPTIRLDVGAYYVSFGDKNLVISCKLPYQKWPAFKAKILEICDKIASIGIVGSVERYSLKYVNIIPAETITEQISKIDLSIRVGDVTVADDHFRVMVHKKEAESIHIITVATGANAVLPDGRALSGVVVDIDSIRMGQFSDFSTFVGNLSESVETLRLENKVKFFSCLTEDAIAEMRPTYA